LNVIKIIKIILLISFSLLARADVIELNSRIYYPYQAIGGEIIFDVYASHIKDLLVSKKVIYKNDKIYYNIKTNSNKTVVKIVGAKIAHKEIINSIKKIISGKIAIVTGSRLSSYLNSHKFKKYDDEYLHYVDETGLLETSEVMLKFKKNILYLIEKKPTGVYETNYYYQEEKWSKGKLVLMKVESSSQEGTQSVETKTNIEYTQISENKWIPLNLTTNVVQKQYTDDGQDITRKFSETYYFKNFIF